MFCFILRNRECVETFSAPPIKSILCNMFLLPGSKVDWQLWRKVFGIPPYLYNLQVDCPHRDTWNAVRWFLPIWWDSNPVWANHSQECVHGPLVRLERAWLGGRKTYGRTDDVIKTNLPIYYVFWEYELNKPILRSKMKPE